MQNPLHRNVYSVDTLTDEIRKLLEMSYADIWVEGEVSSVSMPPSGHVYFTLKDQNSVLKCVLFKNKRYLASILPNEGVRLLIRGRVSVYTARGDVQLICSYLEAAGEGELRRLFESMKNKLAAEGMFDEKNKQPLPAAPRVIALITSSHGAVLHDIISTMRRRYPLVTLKLFPVGVQGEKAAAEIIEALRLVSGMQADIVILARGGGSLEDLQVFNEESVARAVFACPLPVVSAIGHETDFVITDFVADLRAPTPTAAATLVVPDIREIRETLTDHKQRLNRLIQYSLDNKQQQMDLASQKLKHPRDRLSIQTSELKSLGLRLNLVCGKRIDSNRQHLQKLKARLQSLSPQIALTTRQYRLTALKEQLDTMLTARLKADQARLLQCRTALEAFSPEQTLARGYSILQNEQGQIIRDGALVNRGTNLHAQLHRGRLELTVSEIHEPAD